MHLEATHSSASYCSATSVSSDTPRTPVCSDEGLVVHEQRGYERLVMPAQAITDDVLATLPKLEDAVHCGTLGRRWKKRQRKNGVDMCELEPSGGGDPNDDLDISHAMAAKTSLKCHLTEVLSVLVSHHSRDYEASMQALCGCRFRKGKILFQQRRRLPVRCRESTTRRASVTRPASAQEGLVSVQLATMRPKIPVQLPSMPKRAQKLCFASCTYRYPSKLRAIHLAKTIPKGAHDQIVSSDDRSALRGEIDHIAVGYEIQTKPDGGYGAAKTSTCVFLHTYASSVPTSQYSRSTSKRCAAFSPSDMARHRNSVMNPEARCVMSILTKSLRELDGVIRRRRLGFQSFVSLPSSMGQDDANCAICEKHFSLFRRDHLCELCGEIVCGDCSDMHEVEARIGDVVKRRCCAQCVTRVNACVFDDDHLITALGPVVVRADDDDWTARDNLVPEYERSEVRRRKSPALETLAQIIGVTCPSPLDLKSDEPTPVDKGAIVRAIDSVLSNELHTTQDKYTNPRNCHVYGDTHDYPLDFSYERNENVPIAPSPSAEREAERLHYIKASGVLDNAYDRTALDLLAQAAAKKLNCPIGFVSVVGENEFRAVGSYNLPKAAHTLPRDENLCAYGVYAEIPMIIKNPQRDMRFAHMEAVKHLGVRFYAGFPVRAPDGSVVASLCASDVVPHDNISTKDYATMEALTKLVGELLMPKPVRSTTSHAPAAQTRSKSHRVEHRTPELSCPSSQIARTVSSREPSELVYQRNPAPQTEPVLAELRSIKVPTKRPEERAKEQAMLSESWERRTIYL